MDRTHRLGASRNFQRERRRLKFGEEYARQSTDGPLDRHTADFQGSSRKFRILTTFRSRVT